ncbi:MAG: hypothetical protein WC518_02775 [Patescibacteria group bacterium]
MTALTRDEETALARQRNAAAAQESGETTADKWPMKELAITPLSKWFNQRESKGGWSSVNYGSYRWVRVDDRLGLQSHTVYGCVISFVPEPPATPATTAETKEDKP